MKLRLFIGIIPLWLAAFLAQAAVGLEAPNDSVREQKPQESLNSKVFSNSEAKTLVIGRGMKRVERFARWISRHGEPATHYKGVSAQLKARIETSAKRKALLSIERMKKTAARKGIAVSDTTLRKAAEQIAKDYRNTRYKKHNDKVIESATKRGMKIRDIGFGEKATTRSVALSSERKRILDNRHSNYQVPKKRRWFNAFKRP